jgi:hypothetical protein
MADSIYYHGRVPEEQVESSDNLAFLFLFPSFESRLEMSVKAAERRRETRPVDSRNGPSFEAVRRILVVAFLAPALPK